jgi:hypothetical protein
VRVDVCSVTRAFTIRAHRDVKSAGIRAALVAGMLTSSAKPFRWLLALALILGTAACQVGDDPEEEEARIQEERLQDPTLVIENESPVDPGDGLIAAGYCPGCSNCVYRARCLQPRLPTGLTYWRDKLAKINSHTARPGCVAMIYTGSAYGHVAYVSDKHADGTITIREGNWIGNSCSTRRRTPANLNVRGYWCP